MLFISAVIFITLCMIYKMHIDFEVTPSSSLHEEPGIKDLLLMI